MQKKIVTSNDIISLPFFAFLISALLIVLYLYFSPFDSHILVYYLVATPPFLVTIPPILLAVYLTYEKYHFAWISWIVAVAYLFFITTAMHSIPSILSFMQKPIDIAADNHMRICSWNTAYFFEWRRDDALKALKEKDCDFILLQEVWKSETLQKELKQARDTYLANYDFVYDGEFVIFYPKDTQAALAKSTTKAFLAIQTTYKDKPMTFISIHFWNPIVPRPEDIAGTLAYIDAKQEREAQAPELLQFLNKAGTNQTVFILGDFNSTQNTQILDDVQKAGALRVVAEPLFRRNATYPANFPLIRIDYAFTNKALQNNSRLQTVCLPKSSDHCLMILDVLL